MGHKYKLFVPFPSNLNMAIPKDPEAQLFCGILSAKIAILSYDKNDFKKKSKSQKKIADETKTKESKDSDAKIKKKKVKKNEKNKKKLLMRQKPKNQKTAMRKLKKRKLKKMKKTKK